MAVVGSHVANWLSLAKNSGRYLTTAISTTALLVPEMARKRAKNIHFPINQHLTLEKCRFKGVRKIHWEPTTSVCHCIEKTLLIPQKTKNQLFPPQTTSNCRRRGRLFPCSKMFSPKIGQKSVVVVASTTSLDAATLLVLKSGEKRTTEPTTHPTTTCTFAGLVLIRLHPWQPLLLPQPLRS